MRLFGNDGNLVVRASEAPHSFERVEPEHGDKFDFIAAVAPEEMEAAIAASSQFLFDAREEITFQVGLV